MIRHNVLMALRDACEIKEAVGGTLSIRDSALLGAQVALENAMAAIKRVRLVPSSQHEKMVSKLLITRMLKTLAELRIQLENPGPS